MSWIKVEHGLSRKPQVRLMAERLGVSRAEVVGLLVAFWTWVDAETGDGRLRFASPAMIDDEVGRAGFAAELLRVEWLRQTPEGLVIPNFDRHMGKSAKARAMNALRVARHRARSTPNVTPARDSM
jgi:hypothetical protein